MNSNEKKEHTPTVPAEPVAPAAAPAAPVELSLNLHAIKDEPPTAKVVYKDGISFTLCYMDKASLQRISSRCVVHEWDGAKKNRVPKLDGARFAQEFSNAAIKGWDGMTLRKVSELRPIKLNGFKPEDLDKPLKFSHENLAAILESSAELDNFLQEAVTDLRFFKSEMEEELGNSKPSQSGS